MDEVTATNPSQRAIVEDALDGGVQSTDISNQEPALQQSSPQRLPIQDLPHTPRNQSESATCLPTPSQIRLPPTSQNHSARFEQGTPTHSTAKPSEGADQSSPILSAPLPGAISLRSPQPYAEEKTFLQSSADAPPSQINQSPVDSASKDVLARGRGSLNAS